MIFILVLGVCCFAQEGKEHATQMVDFIKEKEKKKGR
jgi:hypothetical protein